MRMRRIIISKEGYDLDEHYQVYANQLGASYWREMDYTVLPPHQNINDSENFYGVVSKNKGVDDYSAPLTYFYSETKISPDGIKYCESMSNDMLNRFSKWKDNWQDAGLPDCWIEQEMPEEWVVVLESKE